VDERDRRVDGERISPKAGMWSDRGETHAWDGQEVPAARARITTASRRVSSRLAAWRKYLGLVQEHGLAPGPIAIAEQICPCRRLALMSMVIDGEHAARRASVRACL
jgi:hypothetical protein